jgi:hypothetical protein
MANKLGALQPLAIDDFFSDTLFASQRARSLQIKPRWSAIDNIERVRAEDLSVEQFRERFEARNRPVVIEGASAGWRATQQWSVESLVAAFADQPMHARGIDMPAGEFVRYMQTTRDEFPLYVFDKEFGAKVPQLLDDYVVPDYFNDDLFALLEQNERPDYRWLLIGGEKSGST